MAAVLDAQTPKLLLLHLLSKEVEFSNLHFHPRCLQSDEEGVGREAIAAFLSCLASRHQPAADFGPLTLAANELVRLEHWDSCDGTILNTCLPSSQV